MRLKVSFDGDDATVRCYQNDRDDKFCYASTVIPIAQIQTDKAAIVSAVSHLYLDATSKFIEVNAPPALRQQLSEAVNA
jgi:hypothetical protein